MGSCGFWRVGLRQKSCVEHMTSRRHVGEQIMTGFFSLFSFGWTVAFASSRSTSQFYTRLRLISTSGHIKDLLLHNLRPLDAIVRLCYTLLVIVHYLLTPLSLSTGGSDLTSRRKKKASPVILCRDQSERWRTLAHSPPLSEIQQLPAFLFVFFKI